MTFLINNREYSKSARSCGCMLVSRHSINRHLNIKLTEKMNGQQKNASENQKSCNPTHNTTLAAHFILQNRTQRQTLLQFIRKHITN